MENNEEKRDALIAAIHREESPGIIAGLTERLAQLKGVVGQALGPHYDAPSERVSPHDVCRATEKMLTQRINELEAARIAYASEFQADAEGDPDVGSIHANIRALKKQVAAPTGASQSALKDVAEAMRKACLEELWCLSSARDSIEQIDVAEFIAAHLAGATPTKEA